MLINFLASLITRWFPAEMPQYEHPTVKQYGRIPKAGEPRRRRFLTLIIILLVSQCSHAQFAIQGGAGITNGFFSAELQAGARIHQSIVTAGYIAPPNNTQPAYFNVRAGHIIAESLHIYGGYVRSIQSTDNKELNKNHWQAGVQYHFCKYDGGSFYAGVNYTSLNIVSAQVGMAWHFVK